MFGRQGAEVPQVDEVGVTVVWRQVIFGQKSTYDLPIRRHNPSADEFSNDFDNAKEVNLELFPF